MEFKGGMIHIDSHIHKTSLEITPYVYTRTEYGGGNILYNVVIKTSNNPKDLMSIN